MLRLGRHIVSMRIGLVDGVDFGLKVTWCKLAQGLQTAVYTNLIISKSEHGGCRVENGEEQRSKLESLNILPDELAELSILSRYIRH